MPNVTTDQAINFFSGSHAMRFLVQQHKAAAHTTNSAMEMFQEVFGDHITS
jgi:hypothetical protein